MMSSSQFKKRAGSARSFRFFIFLCACLLLLNSRYKAQTTIYSTNFGTIANVNPAGWTFTGQGMNISTNNASVGYAGASAGACLGEGNSVTFTNTSGSTQTSSPLGLSEAILMVSTSGFSNVALSFGMRKSSATYNTNATYTLSWSTNGSTFAPIVYTEATAGIWDLVSGAGLTLPPAAANQPSLYIKWAFDRTGTSSNFKIDDVSLLGNLPVVSPASIAFLSNDTTASEAAGSASIYLRLTASSTASAAITVSASVLSNAGLGDYSIPSQTIIIPANSPVNSTFPVSVSIVNDLVVESAEYIVLRLVNPVNTVIGSTNQCTFYIADNDKLIPSPSNAISLNLLASFSNGAGGSNSAEIVAHDPSTQRLYIANSIAGKLDIVNFVNPSAPSLLASISVTPYGNINSVAVYNGTVAAAIENFSNPQDSGKVVFFNSNGTFLKQVNVGMMPDMITFNRSGTKVITANEGEPNAAYTNDPDGSVSIVNISGGITNLSQSNVSHVTFTVYNGQESALRAQGIRIYGLNASASKDFEPEYVAVAQDDSRCWVTLQENNAVVEINLNTNTITAIRALGTKNHNLLNNGMDASNVTKGINISNVPVKGFYLPDAIATYTVGGANYIITANEGDTRAYAGFSEETRVASLNLDPLKFPNSAELKNNYLLGRLTVTDKNGDSDTDGDIDTIYSIGARSFSIWNATTGVQVYDSKDDLELITATNSYSNLFNSSHSNTTRKDRSDDKGPEPEGVTIGTIGSSIYAFIALERIGGVMVYEVTNPLSPVFVTYVNNRSLPLNGPDLGSEGILFIPQSQSPNGQHLVIAANEISSTLSIWGIAGCASPLSSALTVSGQTAVACSAQPPVLSVAPSGTLSYQWYLNGQTISGATSNSFSPSATGSYSVAISGGTNCNTSSLTRSFTIQPTPTLAVAGPTSVCIGSALSQTVSGASTYTWNNSLVGSVVTLAPASSGIYTIAGTSTNNCIATITSTISVRQLPAVLIALPPQSVCAGQTINLSASGATSYSWNTGASGSTITTTPMSNTSYFVIGTDAFGCAGTGAAQLTVNPSPAILLSASSISVCAGAAISFTASGASTYTWSTGATGPVVSTTAVITSTSYSVSGAGNNGCRSGSEIQISVFPRPSLVVTSSSPTVCVGETATLSAGGASNFSWLNGSIGASLSVQPTITTQYTVTGSSNQGCTSSMSILQVVDACTGIQQIESRATLAAYPNPAANSIHLSNPSGTGNLIITDASGKTVKSILITEVNQEIPVSDLARGLYFLNLFSEGTSLSAKVILE